MATKKAPDNNVTETTDSVENDKVTDERTEAKTYGPDSGSANILAAWQGLYHLLGAEVERWDVTNEGVVAVNLTFDSSKVPDTETVIRDISYRGDKTVNRSLDLIPTYFWVNGDEPAPFEDAGEMTQWMAKFFRGAGEGDNNRSPQYVKDAISAYKTERGIAARRGRPPKKIDIETLGSVDEAILAQVPAGELEKLQATLARLLQHQSA